MFSIRRATSLIVFICLVISELKSSKGYEVAPNCKKYECPSYTVVANDSQFEIRSYNTSQWVSAPPFSSNSYKEAARKGFLILFAYYNGNNRDQVKINMTSPVLVDVQNSTYTVYFYLPTKFQNSVPEPRSNEIKLVKLPKRKYVAVRRFDGFITDIIIPEEVALLKKFIQGSPYRRAGDVEEYTVAGYNSPFELTNHANEILIWFD